jgi:hypothetical protein
MIALINLTEMLVSNFMGYFAATDVTNEGATTSIEYK